MTARPSLLFAAAAGAGLALFALSLRFRADAADFRAQAVRLRAETASMAPNLALRAENDAELAALRQRLAAAKPRTEPAALFAHAVSPAPNATERPHQRLTCGLDAFETDLDASSADPDALSAAIAAAEADGHRLVRLAVEPVPGGRVRAFLTFRTYALP